MRLSALQKFILQECYFEKKKRLNRQKLTNFYNKKKKVPKEEDQVSVITKSLERLIKRGLLVGYGVRTPEKWFIKEIRLTVRGRKVAKELFGKQQKLRI